MCRTMMTEPRLYTPEDLGKEVSFTFDDIPEEDDISLFCGIAEVDGVNKVAICVKPKDYGKWIVTYIPSFEKAKIGVASMFKGYDCAGRRMRRLVEMVEKKAEEEGIKVG